MTAHNEQAVQGALAYTNRGIPAKPRTHDEVAALFGDWEIVDPGVVMVHRWRPAGEPVDDVHVQMSGAVAIKP